MIEQPLYFEKNSTKYISVSGELLTDKEIKNLLTLLTDSFDNVVNITFLHANVLPAEIIERLVMLQNNKRVRIYVFKRYLYSYLNGLGIKSEFVTSKALGENPVNQVHEEKSNSICKHELTSFLENINLEYGYDYTDYQLDSITRRIKISMLRCRVDNFKEFQGMVLKNREMFEQLFLDFSINTTEFFRDPDVFLAVRNTILPYLSSFTHIKIWCVGCSSGKEAYSLAILLDELELLEKTHIYATDINPFVIEEAKNGLYTLSNINNDITNYKQSGGTRNFVEYFELKGNYMKVKKHLKKKILFFQHSLVGSGVLNEFQLIVCRNVLIYFNPKLQREVLQKFYASLDLSGFLITGKSEGMLLNGGGALFSPYLDKEKIYKARYYCGN